MESTKGNAINLGSPSVLLATYVDEVSGPDVPTPDVPDPDVPDPDVPTPDVPGPDVPDPDVPDPDVPTPDVPSPDVPGPDVPGPDVPGPDVPGPDVPGPDVPTPDVPGPDVPTSDVFGPYVPGPDVPTPDVMAKLALVLGAAVPGGLSGVSSEQALTVIEAVEAVKAWADAVSIDATATMITEFESDFVHLGPETPTVWERRRFVRTCRSAAAREIQVATGLPISQCQRRVWLAACEQERTGPLLERMRAGQVALARAMTLTEATAHLDGFIAATIAARVLRALTGRDGSPLPGMAPLSQATFRARLHRQLVLHHGLIGQAERTYDEALKNRRASLEPNRDGTGALQITGNLPRLGAAMNRVDNIARLLRKNGDPRTLDQLRADVATDLLLRGWIPTDPTFTTLGEPPTAQVQLIVSLPTILGLDHGCGHLTGWADIPAHQARDLALHTGSIWKRIVTDPLTGRAIEVTAKTYKVPAAMAEQVKTRDRTCRAPGCEIPADRCDHDHTNEWQPDSAGGPTAEPNLATVHRGHHNLKTAGFWDSDQSPDGTLTWTTATGRTMTTYPYIYDHPDNLPIQTSPLEQRLGTRLAAVINPDIPLPGHFNLLDEIDWRQALTPATPQPPPHTWAVAHANQNRRATTGVAIDDYPPPPF